MRFGQIPLIYNKVQTTTANYNAASTIKVQSYREPMQKRFRYYVGTPNMADFGYLYCQIDPTTLERVFSYKQKRHNQKT